jgi:2-phosphosulfolactate phosphatase
VALSRGAVEIILVAEPQEALALRAAGRGQLCMGEVDGRRPEGFDFGNSPFELSKAELGGKSLIQSTRAGTVGVCAVPASEALYAGSLVTAGATAQAVRRASPGTVTIVAMGVQGRLRSDEDELCALYLRNRMQGVRPDAGALRSLVLAGSESLKYDDPERPQFHPRDRDLALAVDAFDFAIRVEARDGLHVARAETANT